MMKKRWAPVLLVSVMILGTAGACDPPPPSGWQPPNIESAALSTTEIVAGSQFTLAVLATDDNQVVMVKPSFHGPHDNVNGPYPVLSCSSAPTGAIPHDRCDQLSEAGSARLPSNGERVIRGDPCETSGLRTWGEPRPRHWSPRSGWCRHVRQRRPAQPLHHCLDQHPIRSCR